MMAGLTLECDDCYDCYLVVVDSGGVVRAMGGFLYALPGWCVQRVAPQTQPGKRAPAERPSSGGR